MPLMLAGAQGGLSAISSSLANRAARDAAEADMVQLVRANVDARMRRSEQAQQTAGLLQASQAMTGSASDNLTEFVTQAAGDAGADLQILRGDLRAQLDSVKARYRSQATSPLLSGLMGGVSGFMSGMSVNDMSGIPQPFKGGKG